MQMILPNDQTLEMDHDCVVQRPPAVQWISAEQTIGVVELLPQRPNLADWVEWVDRAGGRWATDAELADL